MCNPHDLFTSGADEVLDLLSLQILGHKGRGLGVPRDSFDEQERAFLRESLEHVVEWLEASSWRGVLEEAAYSLYNGRRAPPNTWRGFLRKIGQQHGFTKLLISKDGREEVRYLLVQSGILATRHWCHPIDALFFTVCQAGVHKALRAAFGGGERQHTRVFLQSLIEIFKECVVGPFGRIASYLPEDFHLQFATASMEDGERNKDLQGADLAIVIGAMQEERPIWRVVLMQAKVEESRGKSDVGRNKGKQFDEIHATGMGAYLFYSKADGGKVFIPTVRLTASMYEEIYKVAEKPVFSGIKTCNGESTWDFASFIALEMRRPQASELGKTFHSVEAVAEALSVGRKLPLEGILPPRSVLFASASPRLNVLEFLPLLQPVYPHIASAGVQGASDPAPRP